MFVLVQTALSELIPHTINGDKCLPIVSKTYTLHPLRYSTAMPAVTGAVANTQCGVCMDDFTDPVTLPCCPSMIYCRQCLDMWLANRPECPHHNTPADITMVQYPHHLRQPLIIPRLCRWRTSMRCWPWLKIFTSALPSLQHETMYVRTYLTSRIHSCYRRFAHQRYIISSQPATTTCLRRSTPNPTKRAPRTAEKLTGPISPGSSPMLRPPRRLSMNPPRLSQVCTTAN